MQPDSNSPPGADDGSARGVVTQALAAGKEPSDIVQHPVSNGWPDDKAWDLVYSVRDQTRRLPAGIVPGGAVPGAATFGQQPPPGAQRDTRFVQQQQSQTPGTGFPGGSHVPYDPDAPSTNTRRRPPVQQKSGGGEVAGFLGLIVVLGLINLLSYLFNWPFWVY